MRQHLLSSLLLLFLPLALGACGNGYDRPIKVADNYDLGRQNVLHVSDRQRTALVSLFDSDVPVKSVRWPSNAVIGLFANQDLWKGIAAPLPTSLARKYGRDESMLRAAWNVYRISVARGLDEPLINRYFNSRLGRRELRGTYLLILARKCYGNLDKVPTGIKDQAQAIMDRGGKVSFSCPKKPAIHARTIPG